VPIYVRDFIIEEIDAGYTMNVGINPAINRQED